MAYLQPPPCLPECQCYPGPESESCPVYMWSDIHRECNDKWNGVCCVRQTKTEVTKS